MEPHVNCPAGDVQVSRKTVQHYLRRAGQVSDRRKKLIESLSDMYYRRHVKFGCQLPEAFENRYLHFRRRKIVMKIKTDFADADNFRLLSKFSQFFGCG